MSTHLHTRTSAWTAMTASTPRTRAFATLIMAIGATSLLSLAALGHPQQQPPAATPNDPALRDYLSANGLLNRGMNELAVGEYRKFLSAHPNHAKAPVARYGLGVALFRMKKYDEAATEMRPLLKADADGFEFMAETLLIVGQSEFELKKWEPSVEPLATLARDYPKHDAADDAAGMAVESLFRLQKFEDIETIWRAFEKNWPESPMRERADYLRGLSLVARKDDAGAAKHLADMLARYPQGTFADRATLLRAQCLHREGALQDAAAGYRGLMNRDDALGADATFGMAVLSQQAGDEKAAAEQYDRFLETWPEHASAATAKIERGRLCVAAKQYDRARELLNAGAEALPARADETAYWLAKCDLREEKFSDAAARLKDAISANPQSRLLAEMKYDRGVALAKADDVSNAIAALDDFRTSFPKHELVGDATALQATLEHQRGGYDASAKLCAEFLDNHPDHSQTAAIAFLAAEDDMLRDKFEDAAAKYQAFLSKHAGDGQARTARYRLGSAQFRLERYDDARSNLTQVVDGRQTAKAYRRGLLMLGDVAFQSSQWDQAITLLSDYLSFGGDQPSADDATLKLGLAYARNDKPDEAASQFAELLANYPDSPHRLQATFERGQVLLSQDKLDDAKRAFEQVEQAGESRFRTYALNHLATIAMRQEDWAGAEKLYAQVESAEGGSESEVVVADASFRRGQALMAAKDYPRAAEAFEATLKGKSSAQRAADATAQRSIALSRSGKHEEAIASIESLATLDSSNVAPELMAAVLYEKAWCLRELDRDADAMQAYRDLLSNHAGDVNAPHAMLELAELEVEAGDHEKAADWLTKLNAIASESDSKVEADVRERGLYRLAVSEFELKRYADAAKHAEAFITAFPESDLMPSALLFAGESHFKEARWQPAGEHFAAIVSKHTDDAGCATAMLRLGECQTQLQRWPDSEATFAKYLERFPDSELWFQAQFGVAFARENRSLHDQAIEAYRKVIDRHSGPTAARAQFQIGECLFAQKKFTDAVRELLKVDILYGYPEWSAAALYEAGRCFEELGQKEQARSQYAQVKEKYPDTEWARLATQRLAANESSTGGG